MSRGRYNVRGVLRYAETGSHHRLPHRGLRSLLTSPNAPDLSQ